VDLNGNSMGHHVFKQKKLPKKKGNTSAFGIFSKNGGKNPAL
jgi:hypothetical protein